MSLRHNLRWRKLFHDLDVMVTYCAGGEFHTVAYDVVLISQDLQRIHGVQCFQTALGHRERIVGKSDLLRLGIQLKHREIVHIAETVSILLDQIQLLAQLGTDMTCIVVRLILFVRNEKMVSPAESPAISASSPFISSGINLSMGPL